MSIFCDFKTNEYWTQSDEKVSQKFYLTLCLYISEILDFAVGLDLIRQHKLNWSITSSYYSIVHGTRMIIFIPTGDFHTGHSSCGDFFSGTSNLRTNWLEKFDSSVLDFDGRMPNFNLSALADYYNNILEMPNPINIFNKIGQIFGQAIKLRNDNNYEAFIIAHEYEHKIITKSLKKLSRLMSFGAEMCLKFATRCLETFIEHDPFLNNYKHGYKYFIETYLNKRIFEPILYRTKKNKFVLRCVIENIKSLINLYSKQSNKPELQTVLSDFNQIENWTSIRNFNKKIDLMRDFKNKIEYFDNTIKILF